MTQTLTQLRGELAAACPDIRAAGPDDAVDGCEPRFVAAPASTAEASALLAAAAGLGLAVLPRGTGSRLHWGVPPQRCDLVVDTRRLDRVIEHAAGDLVVRVQAGVTMAKLAQVIGVAGQRLALDPPPGGTAGGVIATGVAGPLRLRYGSPRDLLIGTTVVRADGVVAHSGGKVVKNVAGYDLGKLFAGSHGTLGLITEATFRLHPRPQAAAYVTVRCAGPAGAQQLMTAAAASELAPSAAELDWPAAAAPLRACMLLEGDPGGVAERAGQLRATLSDGTAATIGEAAVSDQPPPWWGRGPAAQGDGTVLRIGYWAGRTAAVLADVTAAAQAAGLDPAVGGSAAAGVLHAALPASADPAAVAGFVTALRSAIRRPAELSRPASVAGPAHAAGPNGAVGPAGGPANPLPGGSLVVLHAPAAVRAAADLWGDIPAAALMHAIKDQFDPGHRMAPGRFAGGI